MLCTTKILFAQFEGRKFLSGSASVNLMNSKPENGNVTSSYGYNLDMSMGTFKTNTRSAGWRLSNSIVGGKQTFSYYNGNETVYYDNTGIRNAGAGIGRFWQFYKHFNNKTGIFAGPGVDLRFSHGSSYTTATDYRTLYNGKENMISLSAGLSAGIYYHFSEKWWVTASLAFATPVSVDYSFLSNDNITENTNYKQQLLNYRFSPDFTFPSVGFGLRYFLAK